jgi:hypothetical protein
MSPYGGELYLYLDNATAARITSSGRIVLPVMPAKSLTLCVPWLRATRHWPCSGSQRNSTCHSTWASCRQSSGEAQSSRNSQTGWSSANLPPGTSATDVTTGTYDVTRKVRINLWSSPAKLLTSYQLAHNWHVLTTAYQWQRLHVEQTNFILDTSRQWWLERLLCSGMWRRVLWYTGTNIWKEHITSMFRVQEEEYSTLKMEAQSSSEILVIYHDTRCHIAYDSSL